MPMCHKKRINLSFFSFAPAVLYLVLISMITTPVFAKGQKQWYRIGVNHYLASRCSEALEPLYQASLKKGPHKNLAHLYLAHCQSVFGQTENAAYNLSMTQAEQLTPADRALYDSLMTKHQGDMKPVSTLFTSVLLYGGQTSFSPDTTKASSQFYGIFGSLTWPTFNLGVGAESLDMDLKPAALKDYTQSMVVLQAGHFWTPSLKTSLSVSSISTNSAQMKSVMVPGLQVDYFWTPVLSFYGEYYSSSYPKLLADATGTYKYSVDARQAVVGGRFPIVGGLPKGLSGALSFATTTLESSKNKAALLPKTLNKDTQRVEGVLYGWLGKNSLALSYWVGTEALGVRDRGSVVSNGTDRKKGGAKVSFDRALCEHASLGASFAPETYEAIDYSTLVLKEFQSTSVTLKGAIFW